MAIPESKRIKPAAVLLVGVMFLAGCRCGFDCKNNDEEVSSSFLSLSFSDGALDQIKAVVIEIDSISFQRSGAADVVVDVFTIEDLGLVDAESFQVDLLQYRGLRQLPVIDSLELDAGNYTTVSIRILANDVNLSYVQDADDSRKPLTVPAGGIAIPGPGLASGEQAYTLAFGLARSLQFREQADDYILTTEGMRLANDAQAASVTGRIDSGLFDSVTPCEAKIDPQAGNRIYLYQDGNLTTDQLADVFTAGSSTEVPDAALAPYAVATLAEDSLTGSWQYALGYLPAGNYTLAFACDAEGDDPVNFDGFVIPLPTEQSYDIELSAGEKAICDLADEAACS